MSKWTKGLPDKVGIYWLYSYRYGKSGYLTQNDPELQFLTVVEISNGVMLVADGQNVNADEVEEPHYMIADIPDSPFENNLPSKIKEGYEAANGWLKFPVTRPLMGAEILILRDGFELPAIGSLSKGCGGAITVDGNEFDSNNTIWWKENPTA